MLAEKYRPLLKWVTAEKKPIRVWSEGATSAHGWGHEQDGSFLSATSLKMQLTLKLNTPQMTNEKGLRCALAGKKKEKEISGKRKKKLN